MATSLGFGAWRFGGVELGRQQHVALGGVVPLYHLHWMPPPLQPGYEEVVEEHLGDGGHVLAAASLTMVMN